MATLFDEAGNPTPPAEGNQSFLDQYVGDGKKYKDYEELAKAYHNANNFIPKLKEDLDSLKTFTLAQLAERADVSNNNQPNPPISPNDGDGQPPNPAVAAPPKAAEEVDLNERIRQTLSEVSEEQKLQDNSRTTEEAMIRHFGSKEASVEALRAKAEEMGVAPNFLADTAFRSPAAFFRLMEITPEAPRSNNTPNATSDVNPRMVGQNFGGPKPGTYAYYDNIRKTDPKRYWRTETQTQMMSDAQKLGNDFFKR
jgi:hypothetical protein